MKNAILLFIICVVALTIQPAYAYLDPGTGSMVVQILIAMFATVAVFFKSIWVSIKNLFVRGEKFSEEDKDDE